MASSATTTEPAAAETTRRTTTCTCRRSSEGVLPKQRAALVPRAETSMVQTMPGLPADPRQPATLYASLITLLHPASNQSKDHEIPGAPVALCYAILRFRSVNNAQLRISQNALPFTQYDEIAGASPPATARTTRRITLSLGSIKSQNSNSKIDTHFYTGLHTFTHFAPDSLFGNKSKSRNQNSKIYELPLRAPLRSSRI
jgi:hypothetical protein